MIVIKELICVKALEHFHCARSYCKPIAVLFTCIIAI